MKTTLSKQKRRDEKTINSRNCNKHKGRFIKLTIPYFLVIL